MLLPSAFGALLQVVSQISPTSIGGWVMAAVTGGSVSALTIAGWVVSMGVLTIGAKLLFDRQEF